MQHRTQNNFDLVGHVGVVDVEIILEICGFKVTSDLSFPNSVDRKIGMHKYSQ